MPWPTSTCSPAKPARASELTLQCTRLQQATQAFAASDNLHQQVIAMERQRTTALLTALDVQRQSPIGVFVPGPLRSRFVAEQLIISSHEMSIMPVAGKPRPSPAAKLCCAQQPSRR